MASNIAKNNVVRKSLNIFQKNLVKYPGLVADGRDMGTVVFPDARVKFFLTASTEARAQRRYKQLLDKGIDAIFPALLRELDERDKRDYRRSASPMQPASDAILIDTTELDSSEVMEQVLEWVTVALARER